jgi:hypothetical protein
VREPGWRNGISLHVIQFAQRELGHRDTAPHHHVHKGGIPLSLTFKMRTKLTSQSLHVGRIRATVKETIREYKILFGSSLTAAQNKASGMGAKGSKTPQALDMPKIGHDHHFKTSPEKATER